MLPTSTDMFKAKTQIRVRYAETDQMGFVYYGNYAMYFEVARVEALRAVGFSYREMEDSGILMPVLESHITYLKPGKYDDLLTVHGFQCQRCGAMDRPAVTNRLFLRQPSLGEEKLFRGRTGDHFPLHPTRCY